MLNLLIAEDETIERTYLKTMIEKANLGIDHIYLAENGQEAVTIFQEHPCDILILDINMPMKNGLEALREIRKIEQQESICFIVTSYDYFQYAKEAIHLHVEDFILKPADIHEIINQLSIAIEKRKYTQNQLLQTHALVERFNKTRPLIEEECASLMISGQDSSVIQKYLKLLNVHFQSGFCIILNPDFLHIEQLQKLKQDIEDMGVSVLETNMKQDVIYFIIANQKMSNSDVDHILSIIQQSDHLHFGVGSIQYDLETLVQSYAHALLSLQSETQDVKIQHRYEIQDINLKVTELIDDLEDDEILAMKEKIKELAIDCLQKERQETGSGKAYLIEFGHCLVERLTKQFNVSLPDGLDLDIHFDKDKQAVTMELNYKLYNFLRSVKLMQYQQLDHLTRKAILYIKENYHKQISLNDLADALNVSPSHISRVLSNHDKGFSDMLNEYRIKEAKKLIRKGEILKHVAFEVGFRSQSYFAKTFKKAVGMSPKEYRDLF